MVFFVARSDTVFRSYGLFYFLAWDVIVSYQGGVTATTLIAKAMIPIKLALSQFIMNHTHPLCKIYNQRRIKEEEMSLKSTEKLVASLNYFTRL